MNLKDVGRIMVVESEISFLGICISYLTHHHDQCWIRNMGDRLSFGVFLEDAVYHSGES